MRKVSTARKRPAGRGRRGRPRRPHEPASNGSPDGREPAAWCRVALPRPVLQTFVYAVPGPLEPQALPGSRALVPFGRRREVGLIVDRIDDPGRANLRGLYEILDLEPVLSPVLLDLCAWISTYYAAPPGLVYRSALPPGFLGGTAAPTGATELRRLAIRLTRPLPTLLERDAAFGRARRQRQAYEALEGMGGKASVTHMESQLGFSRSVLTGLVARGLAEVSEELVPRDPFLESGDEVEFPERPTGAQAEVLNALREQAERDGPGVGLLHGVTGSGKTLVYLRLIETVRARDRSAIMLVPEISLTPQTVRRFRSAFGDEVAILHSALSAGERRDEWRALKEGRKRIVVGTRSAVFAPVSRPGIIILDEEHDGSYKQSETPRYHARAVAAVRARLEGALCLLGSATPSLESWHNARAGRYRLYELPDRATPQSLPSVELVDLRSARDPAAPAADEQASAGPRVLTPRLRAAIEERLDRGEQSILLLNRRGYSTFLQCGACGRVWSCGRCNVSLTYHRERARLVCHHCASEDPVPERCDECSSVDLMFSGLGTEQVERRLWEQFPSARIVRMDVDTTGGKGAHGRILARVRRREVDILLGTQMIAKGLDFPGVTLVGVINADVGLNLPDFRATEHTFQLIAQVAGRAGRGPDPGEVLVQTARPDHPALRAAIAHDYGGFAAAELADRAEPGYPPHTRLANLVVSGPAEQEVADRSAGFADAARRVAERHRLEVRVVGPAPCPIDRLRSRWRWHFLLKSGQPAHLGSLLRYLARRAPAGGPVRLEIDRDPESLL